MRMLIAGAIFALSCGSTLGDSEGERYYTWFAQMNFLAGMCYTAGHLSSDDRMNIMMRSSALGYDLKLDSAAELDTKAQDAVASATVTAQNCATIVDLYKRDPSGIPHGWQDAFK